MAEKKTKVNKPVANSKKSDKKTWQVIALVVLIAFFVVSLLFLWLYASNKPNYRDLEKAYNNLNIPNDWQLVSQSSNKGLWGMFCSSGVSDTSPCPIIINQFKINSLDNPEQKIDDLLSQINIKLPDLKCDNNDTTELYCSKEITYNNIEVYISLSTKDSHGKNGKWATIIISPKE